MSVAAKRFAFTTGVVLLLLLSGIAAALILTRNAAEPDNVQCICAPYDLIVLLLDDPGPMVMCEEAFVWGES
ncbi:MAG: hypothetical protein HUU22_19650 [Phycisphaerae bacterium]|nr:hypothetical protein [Phycisphaerae bacterium]NUQ48235.1 hypothetical protein [Phycisphaerae bacterium]